MANFVVAPGVTSSGLSLGFNDSLTVSSGGIVENSFFQDMTTVIQHGGEGFANVVTDLATEVVAGVDTDSTVANGGVIQVQSNGKAENIVVAAGGELANFGTANNTFLNLGARMLIQSNGQSADTTMIGGQMTIYSGFASLTEVFGGVEEITGSNSVDAGSEIFSGGVQRADSGGLLSATTVAAGGSAVAATGSELSSAMVESGGVDVISSGSLAVLTTVEAGGEEVISGGTALGTTLSGGFELVDGVNGGTEETIVSAGGEQLVVSSALTVETKVLSGGSAAVETGGELTGTVVSSGGVVIERYFGSAIGTVVSTGGMDLVSSGGITTGTQVEGLQVVSGGETSATTLFTGGQETVLSGGLASATQVSSGGTLTISSGGVADGGEVFAGGALIIDGTISTDATLTVAGHLALGGAVAGPRTLAGTGTLALTGGASTIGAGAALSIAHVSQGAATLNLTGDLAYGGTWTQTKGSIVVDAARTLTLAGTGDRFSGTLNGAGAVVFAAGSDTLSGTKLLVADTVVAGAAVTLAGAIDLAKTLTVTGPGLTVAAQGATLSGGGHLLLAGVAGNEIVGAKATAVLANVDDTILGAGDLGGGSMVLDNEGDGTIGSATGTALVIDTGANTILNSGLIASESAGGLTVKSAVINNSLLGVSVGTLTLDAAVTGTGEVLINAGTAAFAAAFSQNVDFEGAAGVLQLAKSQAYTGAITGFSKTGGTSLDLRDIAFTTGKTKATFVENGAKTQGVLTVTDGTHTALITLVGNYAGSTFTTKSDGHSGTTVVDPTKAAAGAPAVLPLITAMAAFDAGAGHWVPTAESGRTSEHLLVAAHPS